ncbi:MAG: hypothetical protein EHM50_08315 [Lysobacterales bacterium]|nr:MAG: hypothetical protein EHM50_08315 [Xanthomonadales bacterium]
MNARFVVALLAGAATLSMTRAVTQENEDADDEPLRCLSMSSIRSTKVIDDQTVLFFQGRGNVYLNRLERECVGLARYGKFTYEIHTGARHARLCVTDSITVLERNGRGFNCGLGAFEPISRDEADSFLVGPNNAAVATPIELPKEEESVPPAPDPAPPAEPPP